MNNTIKFLIQKNNSGERLDIFLSKKIDFLSRSQIKKIVEKGNITINHQVVNLPSKKVKANDYIIINLKVNNSTKLIPKNISLDVVYEDKYILIINKPKGMVVHPGAGNYENTLANALFHKYKSKLSDISGKMRPGIVHRIDKETSGLLVIAKNNSAHVKLSKQFSDHSITRKYVCLVWGVLRPLKGKIETLICRNKKNRQLMMVSDIKGKKAITNYKTIKVFNIKNIPKISLLNVS